MKITDLKCAIIGGSPVVRITTDEGIEGYGQAETPKSYLKPHVLFYKDLIVGEDPTNVERVMLRIRRMGAFKPWDIAGKAAGVPVYKLLGGKVRDTVRVYNGGVRFEMKNFTPQDYAEDVAKMKARPEGFSIIKEAIGWHTQMPSRIPDFTYSSLNSGAPHPNRGLLTEKGLKHVIACVEAMKSVLGDEIGLALDCGPGWMVTDAIRLAKALEPYNVMWLEDLITGDYTPYPNAEVYRDVTMSTSTPIHTGEQIYLRNNFKDLIEKQAVNIVGPDPADVGGIAEMKWISEYADLHGIMMAPHGIFDGLIGLAAHVQVGAAMPNNYIAFECPIGNPSWWYDIVEGLPIPTIKNGVIEVWDTPGLGVTLNPSKAEKYLREEDKGFFD
jgi:L-alanine-DL-glutamate epimerase-like enolase superfamily enzyme